MSVKLLGASTASTYIYLSPVITVVASALVLGEALTPLVVLGIALVLGGLLLSSRPGRKAKGAGGSGGEAAAKSATNPTSESTMEVE